MSFRNRLVQTAAVLRHNQVAVLHTTHKTAVAAGLATTSHTHGTKPLGAHASIKRQARSLLRAILREASYLPDGVAREYFRATAVRAFRRHKSVPVIEKSTEASRLPSSTSGLSCPAGPSSGESSTPPEIDTRKLEGLYAQARETYTLLVKANGADVHAVQEILGLAYGRTGPQRQRLLAPFLAVDAPSNSRDLEDSLARQGNSSGPGETSPVAIDQANSGRRMTRKQMEKRMQPKLKHTLGISTAVRALAVAQAARRGELAKTNAIRRIDPIIPAKNTWGRPMPLKRVKNMMQKARGRLIHRLLPPLPAAQWEQLKRLVVGEDQWRAPTKRKHALQRHSDDDEGQYTDDILGRTTRRRHRQDSQRASPITLRFMVRRYRELFPQCPVITKDGERENTWTVQYGWSLDDGVDTIEADTLAMYSAKASPEMAHDEGET